MGKKRKRPVKDDRPRDHLPKPSSPPSPSQEEIPEHSHSHPVISLYYPRVVTLRQYLLKRIPVSSKSRRRRIAAVRNDLTLPDLKRSGLATFLDTTLVGVLKDLSPISARNSTQTRTTSQLDSTDTGATSAQEEVLKQAPWTDVLDLLGYNGNDIMFELLRDCGIFTTVDPRKGVYYQVSGVPLFALETVQKPPQALPESATTGKDEVKPLSTKDAPASQYKPNSITFLRRRILYAPPVLGPQGRIQYGLSKRHVLNRSGSSDSLSDTVHVMKYVFPKQFGLRNVFNSSGNTFFMKDFTSREEEISKREIQQQAKAQNSTRSNTHKQGNPGQSPRVPKRLRGKPVELVRLLQTRQRHCSYWQLLQYYCPLKSSGPWKFDSIDTQNEVSRDPKSSASGNFITQPGGPNGAHTPTVAQTNQEVQKAKPNISRPKLSLMDYATPSSSVSAFCRAVLRKLFPSEWYGVGQQGDINQDIVLKHVDRFVRMRRFETLTIHEICKGIKVTSIPWLEHPNIEGQQIKLSLSDLQKRAELLHEFLYYVFDSILMPLIRSCFYVTESQSHRGRLFYFRHDMWHQLTQKPLANLKSSMFDEIKPEKAASILRCRSLGYGLLRLKPKTTGIRPIMNLSRPILVDGKWGKRFMGQGINKTIAPVYSMLNYELTRKTAQFGSCMNCVGDIHARLKAFKEKWATHTNSGRPPFYFVKLDIQASYDTIPQQKLIPLVENLVSEEKYHISNHREVSAADEFSSMWPSDGSRQSKGRPKSAGRAGPATETQPLVETLANGGVSKRRNTVFVSSQTQKDYSAEDLLDLLDEHLQNNLVKFGRKYFRQRKGIPQGSRVSSLLCNLFYGQMERDVLGFLDPHEALLLRLVDDFLLITSNSTLAMKFLTVMVKGQPEYGVTVNPSKSLVNFAAAVEGTHIPRLIDTSLFPYCGTLIDVRTLEVHKDHDKLLEVGDTTAAALSNSLTIASSKTPGRALHQKMLTSFKALMHPMYLDTNHNSLTVVLSNIYTNFLTTAMKMYRYMRALRGRSHPTPAVVIRIIGDLTELAWRLVQTKRQPSGSTSDTSSSTTTCIASHSQLEYLSAAAFRHVFGRKQTRYQAILNWLDRVYKANRLKADGKSARLAQVVRKGNLLYGGWRY
ncbi:Telomerase reverse transcriptase [Aspergillus melleus]|uniref:Telomerase reverse transcriptase n=1 Tax=Aspergillus melleus TaxID=138277 RepID=A0ACC3B0S6_9EURO|nr:Telomerase reverse transcriptase [Aspergillus melleus]